MNWENLTMPAFEELRGQTRTVILPVGALEEHGPHLPLGTDTFHALELARRVAQRRPVVVAPPLFYGMCRSTREHPGTVSLSGDSLRSLLVDLGREFHRQGWRNLIFLSGHAGGTHMGALLEAAETLLAELPQARLAVVNLLDLLREVRWEFGGHEFCAELLLKPLRLGRTAAEIPTKWVKRAEGASKHAFARNFRFASAAWKIRFTPRESLLAAAPSAGKKGTGSPGRGGPG